MPAGYAVIILMKIGVFSAGGMSTNFPANYPAPGEKANQQPRLLWLSCGSEDRLVRINRNLSDWLTARGVRHTWEETPGAHTYQVWRRDLAGFAPLLFQAKKQRVPCAALSRLATWLSWV